MCTWGRARAHNICARLEAATDARFNVNTTPKSVYTRLFTAIRGTEMKRNPRSSRPFHEDGIARGVSTVN